MKAGDIVYIGREKFTLLGEPKNGKVPLIDEQGHYHLRKAASVRAEDAHAVKAWWNNDLLFIQEERIEPAADGEISLHEVRIPRAQVYKIFDLIAANT